MLECEGSTDLEIVVGTYEEFVVGFKVLKTESGIDLSRSFANHSHHASVRCVASGGRYMASGGADSVIQLYDLKLRRETGVLTDHQDTVSHIVFLGTSHIASCSDEGEIRLYRTGNWQCEKMFKTHPGGVTAIALHPSGKLLLTAGKDKKLITWNLIKGRSAYTINIQSVVEDIKWSPSGEFYATLKIFKGGSAYCVDIYAISQAGIMYTVNPAEKPTSILFIDDNVTAISTVDGNVELYNITKKEKILQFKAHEGRIRCMAGVKFTNSGDKWIITGTSTGDIAVWKYKSIKGKIKEPIEIGKVSVNSRITCMTVVSAPIGAVEFKSEVELEEDNKDDILIPPKVTNKSKIIIELEDSDEEVQTQVKNTKKQRRSKEISSSSDEDKTVSKQKKKKLIVKRKRK